MKHLLHYEVRKASEYIALAGLYAKIIQNEIDRADSLLSPDNFVVLSDEATGRRVVLFYCHDMSSESDDLSHVVWFSNIEEEDWAELYDATSYEMGPSPDMIEYSTQINDAIRNR